MVAISVLSLRSMEKRGVRMCGAMIAPHVGMLVQRGHSVVVRLRWYKVVVDGDVWRAVGGQLE